MFSRLCTVYFLSEASCFLYLSIITENCRYWSACFLQLLSSNKDHRFVPVHACSSFQLSLFVEVFVVCFWTKSFNMTPHSFSEFCSCKNQRVYCQHPPQLCWQSRAAHLSIHCNPRFSSARYSSTTDTDEEAGISTKEYHIKKDNNIFSWFWKVGWREVGYESHWILKWSHCLRNPEPFNFAFIVPIVRPFCRESYIRGREDKNRDIREHWSLTKVCVK